MRRAENMTGAVDSWHGAGARHGGSKARGGMRARMATGEGRGGSGPVRHGGRSRRQPGRCRSRVGGGDGIGATPSGLWLLNDFEVGRRYKLRIQRRQRRRAKLLHPLRLRNGLHCGRAASVVTCGLQVCRVGLMSCSSRFDRGAEKR